MIFIQMNVFSEALGMSTDVNCAIPSAVLGSGDGARRLPVLYLLHGLGGDHMLWTRNSRIGQYAEDRGLALVMPRADRSYYTDMKQGGKYFTYLSRELPELICRLLPVSERREDTFAAGNSMGGYGAFKLALSRPDRFAAAASLSGALDIVRRVLEPNGFQEGEAERIFGPVSGLQGSGDDLFALAGRAAAAKHPPELYQCCGTEDFLYEGNLAFRERAEAAGLRPTYEEGPGAHEWEYWDRMARKMIDWLPIRRQDGAVSPLN